MYVQHHDESQAGESPVLRALLPNDPVVYVDVGAGEYLDWNVTWPFYAAGGHGLLIEPREDMWPDFIVHRPRDSICGHIAYDTDGYVQLRLAEGCTTTRADWDIGHIFRGSRTVRAEPLSTILSRYPDIRDTCQLCAIDVEGAERNVILGIDWQTFHPEVIIVEYIRYAPATVGPDISGEWAPLLLANDRYRECCRSWLNIIYLRTDLWERWEAIRDTVQMPHKTLKETIRHNKRKYNG